MWAIYDNETIDGHKRVRMIGTWEQLDEWITWAIDPSQVWVDTLAGWGSSED